MSSPIRPAKDANPALMYAPPWVRDQDPKPSESSPQSEQSSWRGNGAGPDFQDRAIVETRRRRTLEPEWLPGPPQSSIGGGSWWRITLRAGGLFGFAALVAWAFVWVPGVRRLATEFMQTTLGSSISTNPKESNSLAAAIEQRAERLRSEAAASEKAVQQTSDRAEPHEPEPPEPAASAVAVAQAPPPVMAGDPSPQPPDLVLRQLPRAELASMLQRANDFIKAGDLSSARLLLQRAAEAGDAHAALTLASTFDPNVLKALGFQDAGADVALARLWYERAVKFGSAEAPQRLQQLTTLDVAK
ncbi:MAG: hypothetical protein WA858_07845 [Xanthobacteraceae bacterium]